MLKTFKLEPYKETTKKNKTKWYRLGYFVPADIRTDKHTIGLFDFKKLYGKGEKTHDASFNIIDKDFHGSLTHQTIWLLKMKQVLNICILITILLI